MENDNKLEKPDKSRRLLKAIAALILFIAVLTVLIAYKKGLINISDAVQAVESHFSNAELQEPAEDLPKEEPTEEAEPEKENAVQKAPDLEKEEAEIKAAADDEAKAEADVTIGLQPENIEVLEGDNGFFLCFSETASLNGVYEWQRYSTEEEEWETVGMIDYTGEVSELSDENITLSLKEDDKNANMKSILTIKECGADQDGSVFRCIAYDDTKKEKYCAASKPAMLGVIRKDFTDLLISYSEVCEAGSVIHIKDIDIGFRYPDGKVIFPSQPLSDTSFLTDKVVKKDVKNNEDGSVTESTTTSASEQETYEVALGENEIDVRCRLGKKNFEGSFHTRGVDLIEPEFEETATSETRLKADDDEDTVIVTFALKGTDNYTLADQLLYALAEQGTEAAEDSYSKENIYTLQVQENMVYTAYVKDTSGNVGSKEIAVNVKDDTAPVIDAVSLKYPDQDVYCKQNQIIVKAHDDVSGLEYRYTLGETGRGIWESRNLHDADQNGSYLVEVRDKAGNTISEIIEIKNIDNVPPTIKSITSLTKVSIPGSNGVIVGYDIDGNPIYGSDDTVGGVIGYNYLGIPIYENDGSGSLIGYDVNGNEIYGILQDEKTDTDNEFAAGVSTGRDGTDGKGGINGKDEANGRDGINGKDGKNGKDGEDGRDGTDGKDGINGKDGKDGSDGIDGFDGKDGKDGANGKDGKDGINGTDGKDGNSSFFAYADSVNGSVIKNFHRNTPLQTSKWIGVYSGMSAPASQSQYTWSPYKTANSIEFIKDPNKVRITLNPSNS